MTSLISTVTRSCLAISLLLTAPACAHQQSTPSPQVTEAVPAASLELGPALWKVADEDTTIYLFGTVHFLPEEAEWFNGQIKRAFDSSQTLVTEIDISKAAQWRTKMNSAGTLPAGKTLRSLLTVEERAAYETALGEMGLPPEAMAQLDTYEPWYAALNLATTALVLSGLTPEQGSENVLIATPSNNKSTGALETGEFQIEMFDSMPAEDQMAFLNQTIAGLSQTGPTVRAMVDEWLEGDVNAMAEFTNPPGNNMRLHKRFFTDRNANWAVWIDERMDTPGTVFVAVGAGHLAGKDSVQDYLAARGITVTRLQ